MTSSSILGVGIHTNLGCGVPATLEALRQAPPPAAQILISVANERRSIPYNILADLPLGDAQWRLEQAVRGVVQEAIDNAELSRQEVEDAVLVIGTSSMDISVSEAIYQRQLLEDTAAEPLTGNIKIGGLAATTRRHFGIRNQDITINTACTASANALVYADRLIGSERARHAIVLGVELFNMITAKGFSGLDLLTPTRMSPFDRDRDGLELGESSAAVILGPRTRHRSRTHLIGSANLCDTYGISTTNPDGSTIAQATAEALTQAGIQASEIVAIKTHGTASLLNDESEAAGIHAVFRDHPAICALKPFIGHTFGACGLAELILFTIAAGNGFIPGTPTKSHRKSDLGIELTEKQEEISPGYYLLNNFGFGGNITSLILHHEH